MLRACCGLFASRNASTFALKIARLVYFMPVCPLLDQLSGARIEHEFDLIFLEQKAPQIMRTLKEFGILRSIHPQLGWEDVNHQRFEVFLNKANENTLSLKEIQQSLWNLWLETLDEQVLSEVGERLRLGGKQIELIRQTNKLRAALPDLVELKPSRVTEKLSSFNEIAIRTVLLSEEQEHLTRVLTDYLDIYKHVRVYTTGTDLRKRGLSPLTAFRPDPHPAKSSLVGWGGN